MPVERAAEVGEAFISGLQLVAERTLADLGWLPSAPVRERDEEPTNGIYKLMLKRLTRILDNAVGECDWASETIATTMAQSKDVTFAAFTCRIAALINSVDVWKVGTATTLGP